MGDSRYRRILASAFLIVAAMVRTGAAATLEVGLDQPYETIQACIDAAAPGDTCNVHAGTYREQLVLASSGTIDNPIVIRRHQSDVVDVVADTSPVLTINGQSYWTFVGIRFTYDGSESNPRVVSEIEGDGPADHLTFQSCALVLAGGTDEGFAMYAAATDYLTVKDTTITVSAPTGSHDGADLLFSSHLEFSGNTISGPASEEAGRLEDGIVVSGTDLNIENNIVRNGWSFDNHPDGIVVQGDGDRAGARTANVKVVRNTIVNFTSGIYFDAIHNPIEGKNLIANNVIYETGDYRYGGEAGKMNGIAIDGEGLENGLTIQVDIYNNTIATRQLHIIVNRTVEGSAVKIANNLFVGPGYTGVYVEAPFGVSLDYNYYASPDDTPILWESSAYSLLDFKVASRGESHGASGFVALTSDFRETPASDSIGRGRNLATDFSVDRSGRPRPVDAAEPWDIGAYQFAKPKAPANLRILPAPTSE